MKKAQQKPSKEDVSGFSSRLPGSKALATAIRAVAIGWAEGVAEQLNALRQVTDEGIARLEREGRRDDLARVRAWLLLKDALLDFYAGEGPLRERGPKLVRHLTRWMGRGSARLRLVYKDNPPLIQAEFDHPRGDEAVTVLLWRFAEAGGFGVLRLCPGCARFFADKTRNGTQRWCSSRCKVRVTVARWRRGERGRAYQLWRKNWTLPRISRVLSVPLPTLNSWVKEWEK